MYRLWVENARGSVFKIYTWQQILQDLRLIHKTMKLLEYQEYAWRAIYKLTIGAVSNVRSPLEIMTIYKKNQYRKKAYTDLNGDIASDN